eukprot:jgi/Tetstr1/423139/TSEL_013908.t1
MPLLLVRHGERLDYVQSSWLATAPRPWDPPLTETGLDQATKAGRAISSLLREHNLPPVGAAFSSPLTRCVETSLGILSEAGAECKLRVEPALVETVCKEWYHSWGVPGANAEWGGPPECRVGAVVPEDALNPSVLRPAGELLLGASDLAAALGTPAEGRLEESYAPYLPRSALTQRWGAEETKDDTMARLSGFAAHAEAEHPDTTVLLCTHGGPATYAYRALSGELDERLKCGYTGIFLMTKDPATGAWRTLVKASTEHLGDVSDLGFATAGNS